MIKFIGQIKSIVNAADGGYLMKVDISEDYGSQAKEVLVNTKRNIVFTLEDEIEQ